MTTPRQPKRFGETAAAKIDVHTPIPLLQELVGQELRIYSWEEKTSEHGRYAVLRVQQRGQASKQVKCSGEMILTQLRELAEDDFPVEAWLYQDPAPKGRTGMLYFGDKPSEQPQETNLADGPVGK